MSDLPITNPVSSVAMDTLLSTSSKYGGLAKSCRFIVNIKLPALLLGKYGGLAREFPYLCEAAEMPGRGFVAADVRYYGPNQKLPVKTQYEDTTVTILCRSESMERQLFDDWMETINPTRHFNFSYRNQYETTVDVIQFAEYASGAGSTQPKQTYCITLFNAYPMLINPQPMTWADDQVQRLAITFTYHKWKRIGWDTAPARFANLVGGRENIGVPGTSSGPTAPR